MQEGVLALLDELAEKVIKQENALAELHKLLLDDSDMRSHLSNYAPIWYTSVVEILVKKI